MDNPIAMVALLAIGYFTWKMWDQTKLSMMKEDLLSVPSDTTPTEWADISNEQIDPTVVRADPTSHLQTMKTEIGPFGVPREIRTDNNSNFWFPTFGNGFFDQL